jgi:hypothetical protein
MDTTEIAKPERRHATLTVKAGTKRRIEQFAEAGRWTQCALIDLLLDRYAHELPQPVTETSDRNYQ